MNYRDLPGRLPDQVSLNDLTAYNAQLKALKEQEKERIAVASGFGSQPDPWAHRSTGMLCRTCMYFVPKRSESDDAGAKPEKGRCRRHAPTMSGYPVVFTTDWCGDHKLA